MHGRGRGPKVVTVHQTSLSPKRWGSRAGRPGQPLSENARTFSLAASASECFRPKKPSCRPRKPKARRTVPLQKIPPAAPRGHSAVTVRQRVFKRSVCRSRVFSSAMGNPVAKPGAARWPLKRKKLEVYDNEASVSAGRGAVSSGLNRRPIALRKRTRLLLP